MKRTSLFALLLLSSSLLAAQVTPTRSGRAVRSGTAPTIHELALRAPAVSAYGGEVEIPIGVPDSLMDKQPVETVRDPFARSFASQQAPTASLSIEGYGSDENQSVNGFRVAPPDTEGDVGLDYYVQYNNLGWMYFNKSDGSVAGGPFAGNMFWNGFGGPCETENAGDPIVLFDHVAEQWVFSQFTSTAVGHQCFAVSMGSDPAGPYFLYDFLVGSTPVAFNDYPKIGLWTDGAGQSAYHMTANEFVGVFIGVSITAFDRDTMLVGGPAGFIQFTIPDLGAPQRFSLQPPHLEGPVPPAGRCALYIQAFDDETWGAGAGPDGYQLWEFCTDWASPPASTFTTGPLVTTAEFDAELCGFSRTCVPQQGGGGLDTLGQFTMYRFQNRYFPGTGELKGVISHTVDLGGNLAGVRWAQLDLPSLGGASIDDTGTLDVGDGLHRWMPSVALDSAGNMALGYSRSSASTFPSVYFTGREAGDSPGTLQTESSCVDGSGAQLSTNRWGDYSSVSVDPVDDCTFWVTNEYVETTGVFFWNTRICSFTFASCGTPPPDEPDIDVAPASLDFAQVVLDTTAQDTVTISNTGTQPLTVTGLSTTNAAFAVVAPTPATPFVVAAGGSQDVTVEYAPVAPAGVDSGDLDVTSDDPDEGLVSVSLTGEGVTAPTGYVARINAGGPDFTDSSGDLFVADKLFVPGDFGATSGDTGDFPDPVAGTIDDELFQTVRGSTSSFSYLFDGLNAGDYDVTLYFNEIFFANPGQRIFDVEIEGVLVLDNFDIVAVAGGNFTAHIESFTATVSDGQLDVDFTSVNGRHAIVSAVAVVEVAPPPAEPDIDVSPTSVDFGMVETGTTAQATVTISNTGTQDLTVSDLSTTNAVFTVVAPTPAVPFVVGAGGSQDVTLEYAPVPPPGTDSGSLDITSDDPDEGLVSVSLTGEGFAPPPAEPDIDVNPASVNFGQVELDTTAQSTVTISNLGTQDLTVSALDVTNPVFAVVTPTPAVPFVVPQGGSQDVTLEYAPVAPAGIDNGALDISSDDPDEALVTVPLTGEGVEAPPPYMARINAGGPDYTDSGGDLFVADKLFVPGDFGATGGQTGDFPDPVAGTIDDELFQTVRGSTSSFSYLFDGLAPGSYDVTLYFNEIFFTNPGQRIFDVEIEGVLVLDNFDIVAVAGGNFTAHVESFTVNVSDGQLDVDFTSVNRRHALVSAVAVVSTP